MVILSMLHTIPMKVLDHVMSREKRLGALDSCFGLVGPHQQSIPNFSGIYYCCLGEALKTLQ